MTDDRKGESAEAAGMLTRRFRAGMRPLAAATGLFVALSAPVADFLLERHDLERRAESLAGEVARATEAAPNLDAALAGAFAAPRAEEIDRLAVVDAAGAVRARLDRPAAEALWPTVEVRAAFVGGGRPLWLAVRVGEREWLRRDLVLLGLFGALGLVLALALYSFPLRLLRQEDLVRLFAWRSERAAEEERRRLALDLHDGVGQALGAAAVAIVRLSAKTAGPAAPEVAEAGRLVEAALDEVRRVARGLRPPTLDDLGLGPALEALGREAAATGLEVEVQVEPLPRADPELEQACFRLAQEALANVVRHARARKVRLRLARRDLQVVLQVEDDGQGFDPAAVLGLGLVGARERAARLAGTLEVQSAPGRGTRLEAVLPWTEAAA